MPFTSPSLRSVLARCLRSSRLGGGVVFMLVCLLSLALLAGCADVEERPESPASDSSADMPTADDEGATGDRSAAEDRTAAKESDEDGQSRPQKEGDGDEQGRAGSSTPGSALEMLDDLDVKGRAPKTGYDAGLFKWRSDADHNGCDTRNDVLRRDLKNITLKAGTKGCIVIAGKLSDSYQGETYAFDRSPNNIDIDHIVARSNAWQTGAAGFDEETLKEFGNDPLNLLAVSSSLNRQKGDGDAATWLPPNKSFRCEYVSRQIAIKHKYDLWAVKAEKAAMKRVLGTCDGEPAFTKDVTWPGPGDGDNVTTKTDSSKKKSSGSTAKSSPKKASKSGSSSGAGTGSSGSTPFENCTAAREAGAAPVHRGDPGYGKHLDRDGDGIGCE